MTTAIEIVSWLCLVAGGAFSIIGAIGLIRMPDFFTRMHAASVTDTLGAGLLIIGLILQAGIHVDCREAAVPRVAHVFCKPHGYTRIG